jgi:hypothetical protein
MAESYVYLPTVAPYGDISSEQAWNRLNRIPEYSKTYTLYKSVEQALNSDVGRMVNGYFVIDISSLAKTQYKDLPNKYHVFCEISKELIVSYKSLQCGVTCNPFYKHAKVISTQRIGAIPSFN